MTPRLVAVRPYVRTAPVAHPNFNSDVHKQLRRAFALTVMEREIERAVRVEIAAVALRGKGA